MIRLTDVLCAHLGDYAKQLFPQGVRVASVFWVEGEASDPDSVGVSTPKGTGHECVVALRIAADKMEADMRARGDWPQ